MATQVQIRRGTTAQHTTFTGAVGEITVDTDKDTVVVHDGSAAGGYPLLRENGSQNLVTTGNATAAALIPSSSTVPTNGVYLPAANTVGVATNSTGRLFIDSSGGVGVNTNTSLINSIGRLVVQNGSTTASERLIVAANAYLSGPTYTGTYIQQGDTATTGTVFGLSSASLGSLIFQNTSAGLIGCNGAAPLVFATTSQERLRITSDGLVGVGTSSPWSLSTVRSTGTAGDVTSARQVSIGDSSTYSVSLGYYQTAAASPFAGVIQALDNNSGTRLLLNPNGGNVGIGSNSPGSNLSIGTTTSAPTATPVTLDLGGTYSSTAGANGKLKVWTDGGSYMGLGVSAGQLDYITAGSFSHVWHINGSERARLDTSGRLLVGTSTARSIGGGFQSGTGSQVFIEAGAGDLTLGTFVLNRNDTNPGHVVIGKSRGSSAGSNTILQSGDGIGRIVFAGADGTDVETPAAHIGAEVDGTPGANDMPGRLVFSTTLGGQSTPTERMRITNDGKVGIGTQSPGAIVHATSPDDSKTAIVAGATNRLRIYGHLVGFGGPVLEGVNNAESNYAPILLSGSQLSFGIGGSERARIDSSGRLLVGASTTAASLNQLIQGATDVAGILMLARGGSTLVDGNNLGVVQFADSGHTSSAVLRAEKDTGTWTSGTSQPSRLVLATTPNGTASTTEYVRICEDGTYAYNQPAPAAVNTTATLTIANLKSGIITSTAAAAVTMTLPTGTLTEGGFTSLYNNFTFEWSVINTGASFNVTVAASTGHTLVGNGVVSPNSSNRFATRRTAANTWVTYRLS